MNFKCFVRNLPLRIMQCKCYDIDKEVFHGQADKREYLLELSTERPEIQVKFFLLLNTTCITIHHWLQNLLISIDKSDMCGKPTQQKISIHQSDSDNTNANFVFRK